MAIKRQLTRQVTYIAEEEPHEAAAEGTKKPKNNQEITALVKSFEEMALLSGNLKDLKLKLTGLEPKLNTLAVAERIDENLLRKFEAPMVSKSTRNDEDQVKELVEKLELAVLEKNFEECMQLTNQLNKLKAEGQLNNIGSVLKAEINQMMRSLVDALTAEIVNMKVDETNSYLQYLLRLGQNTRAQQIFLFAKLRDFDSLLQERLTQDALIDSKFDFFCQSINDFILATSQSYEQIFKVLTGSSRNDHSALFLTWITKVVEAIYLPLKEYLSQEANIVKMILNFNSFIDSTFVCEKNGYTISMLFEKLLLRDVEQIVKDHFATYQKSLDHIVNNEEDIITRVFSLENIEKVRFDQIVAGIENNRLSEYYYSYEPEPSNETQLNASDVFTQISKYFVIPSQLYILNLTVSILVPLYQGMRDAQKVQIYYPSTESSKQLLNQMIQNYARLYHDRSYLYNWENRRLLNTLIGLANLDQIMRTCERMLGESTSKAYLTPIYQ
eukprot:TRINITY_DN4310_c0_g1_i9.p1 TRINITY_DN4310_c0_g1~~TRINITY_DN4310_c0_g1_i9.p1  ORF type:complete len:499 (-),score=91.54 TRINITY_DN4310_c0_g1_i9:744-2240(-)